jgi:hypothetical protein
MPEPVGVVADIAHGGRPSTSRFASSTHRSEQESMTAHASSVDLRRRYHRIRILPRVMTSSAVRAGGGDTDGGSHGAAYRQDSPPREPVGLATRSIHSRGPGVPDVRQRSDRVPPRADAIFAQALRFSNPGPGTRPVPDVDLGSPDTADGGAARRIALAWFLNRTCTGTAASGSAPVRAADRRRPTGYERRVGSLAPALIAIE